MSETASVISHYRVLREIGRGGSAIVYSAVDLNLDRHVALKVLRDDDSLPEPKRRQRHIRLRHEASIAARLNHPGIVTIFEVGEWEGRDFVAMELLQGETLRARIVRTHGLPVAEVMVLAQQIADALGFAHQHGVIHRDVKPDNVFLLPGGRAKLADFGIARIEDSAGLTHITGIVGSPAYMAPEQIGGGHLDQRTDQFSLAVTLYEALCGRLPFKSDSVVTALHSIVYGAPEPIPDVPSGIQDVLFRALAKNPDDRYPTAAAFVGALLGTAPRPSAGAQGAGTNAAADGPQTAADAQTDAPVRTDPVRSSGPVAAPPSLRMTAPPIAPRPAAIGPAPGMMRLDWTDFVWRAGYLCLAAVVGGSVGLGAAAFVERYVDWRLLLHADPAAGSPGYFPYGAYPTLMAAASVLPVLAGLVVLLWWLRRYIPMPYSSAARTVYATVLWVVALAGVGAGGWVGEGLVGLDRQVTAYNDLLRRARSADQEAEAARRDTRSQDSAAIARTWDDEKERVLQRARDQLRALRADPRLARQYRAAERCLPDTRLTKRQRQAGSGKLVFFRPR